MSRPDWKSQFPISRAGEHKVSRRDFVKFIGVSCTAVAGGTLAFKGFKQLKPDKENTSFKLIAKSGEVPVGETKLFHFPEHQPCLLIHRTPGVYLAFSQSCTHLMCPVHYNKEKDELICPCHNGHFSARNGSVLSGPPRIPLPQYPVSIEGDAVRVHPPNKIITT